MEASRKTAKEKAWARLWGTLQDYCLCYFLDGQWRPQNKGVSYGENVMECVKRLQGTNLTAQQIETIERLVYWTSRAAFMGNG